MPPHPCGCVSGNDLRGGPRVRPPALALGASDLDAAGATIPAARRAASGTVLAVWWPGHLRWDG